MAFENLTDFLVMGKHGIYVWSVYGFCTVALIFLTWSTLFKRHYVKKTLHKRFLRDKTV